MARTTIITITDDLDGTPDATTITFSYAGQAYTIDLSAKNSAKLEKALQPFIEAAQPVRSAKPTKSAGGLHTRARQWALTEGLDVTDRGRVPSSVLEAYKAAGGR